MSKKPAIQQRKQPASPTRPDPAHTMLARIADMAGRGASPDRVRRAVEDGLEDWRGLPPEDLRDRLDAMTGQLGEGIEAAAEQIQDMDRSGKAETAAAERSFASLKAAHAALLAAQGRAAP